MRGLPVPAQGPSTHARVFDHAGPTGARTSAPARIAFRYLNGVGTRGFTSFAAQWLACALPCRRFTTALADCGARLGADVVRYSFIATDSHRLVPAGLPAHSDQVPAFTDYPTYQRRTERVDAAVLGTYLSGINTRWLRGALSPLLRGAPLSNDAVSRLVGRLRDEFMAWSDLAAEEVCYLFLDGWYPGERIGKKRVRVPGRSTRRESTNAGR